MFLFRCILSVCLMFCLSAESWAQCAPDCQCASGGACVCGPACQQPHVAAGACENGQCRRPLKSVLVAPIAAARHVTVSAVRVSRNVGCRVAQRVITRVRSRCCR